MPNSLGQAFHHRGHYRTQTTRLFEPDSGHLHGYRAGLRGPNLREPPFISGLTPSAGLRRTSTNTPEASRKPLPEPGLGVCLCAAAGGSFGPQMMSVWCLFP